MHIKMVTLRIKVWYFTNLPQFWSIIQWTRHVDTTTHDNANTALFAIL